MTENNNIITQELSVYNDKHNDINCVLNYNNVINLTSQETILLEKFTLNTQNFPLMLNTTSHTDMLPMEGFVKSNAIHNNIVFNDWQIGVKIINNSDKTIESAICRPIYYEKYSDKTEMIPMADSILAYSNKYWWVRNSSELCGYINESLKYICGDGNVIFIKESNNYAICVSDSYLNANVGKSIYLYMCDSMMKCFNFNYRFGDNAILLSKKYFNTMINNNIYWLTSTISSNNNMFFASELLILSENLPVPRLISQHNGNKPNETNTILSYDMDVSDLDSIGNSITYTSNNNNRLLSLTEDEVREFSVSFNWKLKSGIILPVLLSPGDYAKLLFIYR